MMNLRHYAVKVGTEMERQIAIDFYKFATHRAEHETSNHFLYDGKGYVGMLNPLYGDAGNQRFVICCGSHSECEQVVNFKNIDFLADTPSRRAALKKAFNKAYGFKKR